MQKLHESTWAVRLLDHTKVVSTRSCRHTKGSYRGLEIGRVWMTELELDSSCVSLLHIVKASWNRIDSGVSPQPCLLVKTSIAFGAREADLWFGLVCLRKEVSSWRFARTLCVSQREWLHSLR